MIYTNYAINKRTQENKNKQKPKQNRNNYLQNNKKTDKVKAAQKYFRAHSLSFLYTFWHVFIIAERETPCVLGSKHTLLFPLVEPLRAKPNIK